MWVAKWSLQDLAKMILRDDMDVKLKYNIYFRPRPPMQCLTERDLSECLRTKRNSQKKSQSLPEFCFGFCVGFWISF